MDEESQATLKPAEGQKPEHDKKLKKYKTPRAKLAAASASSALGARLFYFITYGLFYLSLLLYRNPMRDILFFATDFTFGNLFYLFYYFGIHGLAIYYFLTAGGNPGFVEVSDPD